MVQNEQIVLADYPDGIPKPSDFKYEEIPVATPKDGEVVVEIAYISADPYMRNRMKAGNNKSYIGGFQLGEPIVGFEVGKVIESNHADFKNGDIVVGMMPWQKYCTVKASEVRKVPDLDVPAYLFLGVLGMPGQTAYHGLLEIGKPKAGETVVVSAASGAVGSVVGQIAKIKGARVVGIAGSEKKLNYLVNDLHFDAAINYKLDDFPQQLKAAVPDGVDVYFENVGGFVGNEVLKHLNTFARIPVCGAIAIYNEKHPQLEPPIQPILIRHQALMQGFLVHQFEQDFERAGKELAQWVKEGKIKTGTSIAHGFDQVPEAFSHLFTGEKLGKQVIKISDVLDK